MMIFISATGDIPLDVESIKKHISEKHCPRNQGINGLCGPQTPIEDCQEPLLIGRVWATAWMLLQKNKFWVQWPINDYLTMQTYGLRSIITQPTPQKENDMNTARFTYSYFDILINTNESLSILMRDALTPTRVISHDGVILSLDAESNITRIDIDDKNALSRLRYSSSYALPAEFHQQMNKALTEIEKSGHLA